MSVPAFRCESYAHGTVTSLRQHIRSDIRRFMTKSAANLAAPDDTVHRVSAFLTPQILAQTTYRVSHFLHVRGWRRTATLLARLNSMVHKINLPPHTCIGPGLHIPHPCGVTFCGSAGAHLTLYSLATCGADAEFADGPLHDSPFLGDRVTSGAHAAVMGRARLGDDVSIGLYTHRVVSEVPAGVLVSPRVPRPALHRKASLLQDFQRTMPADPIC